MKCDYCNKEFNETKYQKSKKKKGKRIFCSKECFRKWLSLTTIGKSNPFFGKKHTKEVVDKIKKANYKQGKSVNGQGYSILHRTATTKAKREHRIIMEKFLGRPLSDCEVVHHKNKKRNDNRIENLQVMTKSEHTILHNKERLSK